MARTEKLVLKNHLYTRSISAYNIVISEREFGLLTHTKSMLNIRQKILSVLYITNYSCSC